MIRIYKQSNNGEISIITDCKNAEKFIDQLATAINDYINLRNADKTYGDQERNLQWLLTNAFKITAQLIGYNPQYVRTRQHLLFAGDHWPTPDESPVVEVGRTV